MTCDIARRPGHRVSQNGVNAWDSHCIAVYHYKTRDPRIFRPLRGFIRAAGGKLCEQYLVSQPDGTPCDV